MKYKYFRFDNENFPLRQLKTYPISILTKDPIFTGTIQFCIHRKIYEVKIDNTKMKVYVHSFGEKKKLSEKVISPIPASVVKEKNTNEKRRTFIRNLLNDYNLLDIIDIDFDSSKDYSGEIIDNYWRLENKRPEKRFTYYDLVNIYNEAIIPKVTEENVALLKEKVIEASSLLTNRKKRRIM